jgi:hypothetical protein
LVVVTGKLGSVVVDVVDVFVDVHKAVVHCNSLKRFARALNKTTLVVVY